MDAQYASPSSALQVATSESRNYPRPAEPYRETTSFGDLLQATGIAGRIGDSYRGRPARAETSLLGNGLSRADDRMRMGAEKRDLSEPDRYDWRDPQEERRAATMMELGVEPAPAKDYRAADEGPPSVEVEDLTAADGADPDDEACSACETETALLSFSRCIPLKSASITMASQSDTNGQAGVAPVPSGPATAAIPAETVSTSDTSAQARVHSTGAGVPSRASSMLVPQAVLAEGGGTAGVGRLGQGPGQAPEQSDAPSQSPTSLTPEPGDAGQPAPIAVALVNISSGAEAGDEVAGSIGGTGVEGEARSAHETGTASLPSSLRVPLDVAKPASASQSDTNGHAGAGRVASDPVAVTATSTESASIDGNPAQAKVNVTGEGLSSRPPLLLVPQAVFVSDDEAGFKPAHVAAHATSPGAPGSDAPSLQPGQVAAQATKPTEAPSPQSPASHTQAPGDTAQSLPFAVAPAPDLDGAGNDDLAQGGDGFPAASGGHVVATRASATDGLLAAKPAVAQVAVHVAKAAKAGLTRIEIELEPASLGKVEVRLDFGRDGRISAMFVAETREALDALRTDARTLERALSEAGVKTDSASLDFSLREHGQGTGERFSDRSPGFGRRAAIAGAGKLEAGAPVATEPPRPPWVSERRLDIRA